MNQGHFSLKAAERVEILTLMDNYVDLLLRSGDVVTRPSTERDGMISEDTLVAEHGLSLLVTVFGKGERHTVLFDTGHTAIGVPHNIRLLGVDLGDVEAIVLSHGHMDHTGALYPILEDHPGPVPLVVHPAAFYAPRYLRLEDGRRLLFPDTLKRDELEKRGARIQESEAPVLLAGDMILVTGEVERTTDFEKGFPAAVIEREGKEEQDPIRDDQSLVIHLKDKGLVVVSGCAHSGIINTVLYGKKITGIETIHTIIGGFHLSGPVFEPVIEKTVEAMKPMDPKVLVPMHCTGWNAVGRFSEAFPEAFILNSVGSRFILD
ncbi:MAG: MBL fold metallo-hydrolase [Deltaproteobacteria bacterium]|nr:MBL fold metallo-hydrolase [Deltaproteobacteria bacterium]MBW2017555.1 MBL fold metallo-hydrolase [Deltaproteobacteria bacterium]MBW2128706.1 MBL fold metallo-hydrolase [Deltaproteobacteria bacterium]